MQKFKGLLYAIDKKNMEYRDYLTQKTSHIILMACLTMIGSSAIFVYVLSSMKFSSILLGLVLLTVGGLVACLIHRYYSLLHTLLFMIVTVFPLLLSFSDTYWSLAPFFKLILSTIYQFIAPNFWVALIEIFISELFRNKPIRADTIVELSSIKIEGLVELYETTLSLSFILSILFMGLVFCCRYCLLKFIQKYSSLKSLEAQLNLKIKALQELQEKLETANEIKEIFIQNFSHEMNNAMNGILGAIRLAKDENKNSQVSRNLSCAEACAEVIRTFASNVIDTPKIDLEEFKLCLEVNSVPIFFRQTWNIIREVISNKNLNGFIKISKRIPQMLQFDTQRLIQIFINLTLNATKYTRKGQIYFVVEWNEHHSGKRAQSARYGAEEPVTSRNRVLVQDGTTALLAAPPSSNFVAERIQETSNCTVIHVRTEKIPTSVHDYYFLDFSKINWESNETFEKNPSRNCSGILKFFVFDTGSGMDAEDIEKLLEGYPGITSEKEKSKKIEMNLGLWVTKQLLAKMKGTIKVKTLPDVGSLFEVQIPLMVPGDQMSGGHINPRKMVLRAGQRAATSIHGQPNEDSPISKKKKVLVVDDDLFNIQFMSSFVNKSGRECLIATDGEQALAIFLKHQKEIGLVLTDNSMPKMSGLELARRIKQHSEASGLNYPPLYLITADVMGLPDTATQKELMISEVITKPINFEKLTMILGKF